MKTMKRILLILSTLALLVTCFAFSASAAETYELVTDASTLAVGDKVIIVAKDSNVALSTNQKDNNRGQADVTKSGNTITNLNSSVQVLTLETGKTAGTFAFYTGSGYLYAASSEKNYLRTEKNLSANSSWTITIASTGVATVKATGSNTRNWMQYNKQSSLFASYGSAQQSLCIYKLKAECQHPDEKLTYTDNLDGSTHKIVCPCGEVINESALHEYDENQTCSCGAVNQGCAHEYEFESNGNRTHTATCSLCQDVLELDCEDSSTSDGHCDKCGADLRYTATFSVPKGFTAPEASKGYNTKVEFSQLSDYGPFKFQGWTTETGIKYTQTCPKTYTVEDTFNLEADTTFYAVYSFTETAIKENPAYVLIEDASNLKIGAQTVIAAAESNYALSTNQKSSNRDAIGITKEDNNLTVNDEVQVLTLAEGDVAGTFAFYTGSGYLYASSSSSNQLKTKTDSDDNASWKITISGGIASIVAQGTNSRNVMQYNPNNGSPLFACYASASQQPVAIYQYMTEVETVTYTSVLPTFSGAQVNLGADLAMKYSLDGTTMSTFAEDLKVKFTFNGVETIVSANEGGKFVLANISPDMMDANIKAEILYGEAVIGMMDNYSVNANLESLKASDPENEALCNLCDAIAEYGKAAKAYKAQSGEINSTLTALDSNAILTINGSSDAVYFTSALVFFGDTNKITIEYSVVDTQNEYYLNGKKISGDGSVTTEAIFAAELGNGFTFEITDAEGKAVKTLTYNVYQYCSDIIEQSNNDYMKYLATALNNYGVRTSEYIGGAN